MTLHRVVVDGAEPAVIGDERDPTTIEIHTSGPRQNLNLEAEPLGSICVGDLPRAVEDLVVIATVVYSIDARVVRVRSTDVFGKKWRRHFAISLPVLEPDLWNEENTRSQLVDVLSFLTGDAFEFRFVPRKDRLSKQLRLAVESSRVVQEADTAVLFSGGLDSLAASIDAIDLGRKPLLVSHRPATQIQSRQQRVLEALRPRVDVWDFPLVGLKITAVKGKRPVEFSQRSRAFLFAALGAAACDLASIEELHLSDNGVVSLNLPQSAQNVGTLASRSTHPGFLFRLQSLLRRVLDRPGFEIKNTLLEHTKLDVIQRIARSVGPELIQETVSCAHTEGKTRLQPHCGVCTQCIDRRFATVAAGLEQYDLVERYEQDVFTADLAEGEPRTHAENFVRFARRLADMTDIDSFAVAFVSELTDACPSGDFEPFVRSMWPVFRRHQQNVETALNEKFGTHGSDLMRGLPEHCLLRLVAGGVHLQEPRLRYAQKLGELLQRTLPANFQSAPPESERRMQEAGQAAFLAAREKLDREAPQVPFGAVCVKPDFSSIEEGVPTLCIEFKLLKERKRLNKLQEEIAADILQYPNAVLLFVVYDHTHVIVDTDAFVEAFEAKGDGRVVVVVVR